MSGTDYGPEDGSYEPEWMWWECDGSDTVCAGADSCDACTSITVCGWCPSSGSCMVGTADGPDSGSCYDWEWARSECSDGSAACGGEWEVCCGGLCGAGLYCDEGYCYADDVECGGEWGPCCAGGACGSGLYCDGGYCYADTAPVDPCADYDTCDACTAEAGCGWCDGWCVEGDAAGSYYYSCGSWAWTDDACL